MPESGTLHGFDFLETLAVEPDSTVIPVFGSDRFLRLQVVDRLIRMLTNRGEISESSEADTNDEFAAVRFDGDQVQWAEVNDELATVSLFSTGARIVVINDADKFVKDQRDQIESLITSKARDCHLILCVNTWAANTKLYKLCDKNSVQIDVGPPQIRRGKSKSRDDKRIVKWIVDHAKSEYGISLTSACATQVLDLLDDDFGRMDQELAKISLIKAREKISPDDIVEIIGGWKAKSVWQAVDHATDGEIDQALALLNRLLQTGEHPLALYGQLSWSLRRFGQACEIYLQAARAGQTIALRESLKQAGFRGWGGELEEAERRMKRLGRPRALNIHRWLLETDMALKGSHSHESRARFALEMLFAKIGEAA